MNIAQAKKISIRKVLESFSLFPSKENSKTAFYFAFNRKEKTPSLSVNFVNQTAFDFGTGKKYDQISIVQEIKTCSASAALEYLSQFDINEISKSIDIKSNETTYKVLKVQELKHPALLDYLKSRKLLEFKDELTEIYYQLANGKQYFGIAFKNDSGGYEVRNKYAKLCIGAKDHTSVIFNYKSVNIFEGWLDYYSFLKFNHSLNFDEADNIILNSTSLVYRLKNALTKYHSVHCFADNDEAGNLVLKELKNYHLNVIDERLLYKGFKDLNEFLARK